MKFFLAFLVLLSICSVIIFLCNYWNNTETRISKYSVLVSRVTGIFSSVRYFHDKLMSYEMVQEKFNTIFTFERFAVSANSHSWRITLHNETVSGSLVIMPINKDEVLVVYRDRLMFRPAQKIQPMGEYGDLVARAVKLHKTAKKRFQKFIF
jgi:uncharacterized membrane protein YsdA (DUF1294 family)